MFFGGKIANKSVCLGEDEPRNVDVVRLLNLINCAKECRLHSVRKQKQSFPSGLV